MLPKLSVISHLFLRNFFFLCIGLTLQDLGAQNLVPNGSFEDYECEQWGETWFPAAHWFNPNDASPDLWSTADLQDCGLKYIFDNDFLNVGEWQWPHYGGRYLGMYHIQQLSCTREYVEARLSETLIAGNTYCVEMYVSLANRSKLCTNCLGVAFTSDSLVNFETYCELSVPFAVWNGSSNTICDTLNWTLVSGEYTAQGGENFIILGNVWPNDSCILQSTIGSDPSWSEAAYYFIDDVSLELCSVPESVEDLDLMDVQVFPNPFTNTLSFVVRNSQVDTFRLNQIDGKTVRFGEISNNLTRIDTSGLHPGVYTLHFFRENQLAEVHIVISAE